MSQAKSSIVMYVGSKVTHYILIRSLVMGNVSLKSLIFQVAGNPKLYFHSYFFSVALLAGRINTTEK